MILNLNVTWTYVCRILICITRKRSNYWHSINLFLYYLTDNQNLTLCLQPPLALNCPYLLVCIMRCTPRLFTALWKLFWQVCLWSHWTLVVIYYYGMSVLQFYTHMICWCNFKQPEIAKYFSSALDCVFNVVRSIYCKTTWWIAVNVFLLHTTECHLLHRLCCHCKKKHSMLKDLHFFSWLSTSSQMFPNTWKGLN